MNKYIGIGRLTRDPEVRYTSGEKQTCIARFSIAINRKFKTNGKYEADFINCVAMAKTGEFVEKYFHKGDMIAVEGRIQTGSYKNKDGQTVYTTDVMCESVEFAQSKSDSQQNNTNAGSKEDFMDIPDGIEDDLPFA